MSCKFRWEVKKREEEKLDDEEKLKITDDDKMKGEEAEAKTRSIFDPVGKVVNMNHRRVTDIKENTRVTLPKALNPSYEVKIEVRAGAYQNVFDEYRKEKCSDEKGRKNINLTKKQEMGLKSLRMKIRKGDMMVCPTD